MVKKPGLRERKKLAAMRRIQTTALDLFDEHGFDAVTIERIAEAADVSPSSVYRYFGTKERIVLYDEYDPVMFHALARAQPGSPPLAAVREALNDVLTMAPDEENHVARRMRYTFAVPSVNATLSQELRAADETLRETFARLTGLDKDDFELQVFTSSVLAAFVTAMRYWVDHDDELTLVEAIERALNVIEHDLAAPPDPSPAG